MLGSNIRTALIPLIAASGIALATGPLTPVASATKKSVGGTAKVRQWHNTCSDAQISYENALTIGENKLAKEIKTNANATAGCSVS